MEPAAKRISASDASGGRRSSDLREQWTSIRLATIKSTWVGAANAQMRTFSRSEARKLQRAEH
jgi:hypothetical protein